MNTESPQNDKILVILKASWFGFVVTAAQRLLRGILDKHEWKTKKNVSSFCGKSISATVLIQIVQCGLDVIKFSFQSD